MTVLGVGQAESIPPPLALGYADFIPTAGRVSFPDICCDLIWARGEVFIAGPESKPTATTFSGERVKLLRIDPFVTRAWLGVPLGVIANRRVALSDIDPSRAAEISALAEANVLTDLLQSTPAVSPPLADTRLAKAADVLLRTRSVRTAACASNLSERQLERLFSTELGVSPYKFAQIVRFRIAAKAARGGATLADSAALAGYADQAHFTRETRAFTGKPPRSLIRDHVGIVQDAERGRF